MIETKNNISIVLRDRGKIVHRWEGHNIWLKAGNEWLAALIRDTGSYLQPGGGYGPVQPTESNRIRYIGFGIGGFRQSFPVNVPNVVWTTYCGGLPPVPIIQSDSDPSVSVLEYPVFSSPGLWLRPLDVPVMHDTNYIASYTALLGVGDLTFLPGHTNIPISEIGLYTNAANPASSSNQPMAYDACDVVQKTDQYEMHIIWTVRF
jgi:hypothetical protein